MTIRNQAIETVRPDDTTEVVSGWNEIIPTGPFIKKARPKGEHIQGSHETDSVTFLDKIEDAMKAKTLDGKDKEGNTP